MKKIVLFAIIALSINAFAQIKQPTSDMQSPTSNLKENVRGHMIDREWNTSRIYSEDNAEQVINHQPLKQRKLIQIDDSIYWWQWDTINIGWKINYKYIDMVYDAKKNLTSQLGQSWNGSAWVNSDQYIYVYDANNNEISELSQSWNGSAWENSLQYIYTYDANNNQTSYIKQSWNVSTWVNSTQVIYTYDANNNMTSVLVQHWNGSAWVNYKQNIYTHDANNHMILQISQNWDGSAWVNSSQFINTFTNNNLTSQLAQYWNGSSWVDSDKSILNWDANNNCISMLTQSWNGGAWVNFFQYIYTYDANNNCTYELDQLWNGSAWVNFMTDTYTYDDNNFTKSESWKEWNISGTKVEYGDSIYYYFHTNAGINDFISQEKSIIIYPNPSNGRFSISSNIPINSIEIYNLFGERIISNFKFKQQTLNEIDLLDYAKGIYFIKIHDDMYIYTEKVVIQ